MHRPSRPAPFALVLTGAAALALAEPAPPPPPEIPPAVRYKPGSGFTLAQGDDFTLQVTGRIQARHEYSDYDEDRGIPNLSQFTSERVRVGVKGTMFKDFRFELEEDFGKGKSELKKALVEWARHEQFRVEVGQFNAKFDRSQYTSSAKQEFVDRSIAAREFGIEYDIGLGFAGSAANRKLQWNAGIFDGEKAPTPFPSVHDDGHLYVARVSINPNGDFGVGESDIKKTDYHLWYVDIAAAQNDDLWSDANGDKRQTPNELTDQESLAFGFGYKHAGLFLAAEGYWRDSGREDGSSVVGSDGFYAQVGYTIVRDKWEVAARWSELDPNDEIDDDTKSELCLGLARYFKGAGHALKLNADFSWLTEEKAAPADDLHDFRVRSQFQVVF